MYSLYETSLSKENKWSKLQSFRKNTNRYGIGCFV